MNPETKIVHKGKWLTMYEDNGYEFFHRHRKPDAVGIIALTEDHKFILVEQNRKPQDKPVFEIPAGLVDDGETFEQTAVRELLEETGYGDGKIQKIFNDVTTTPGICTEKLQFVIITDLKKVAEGGGLQSENEHTTVHLLDEDTIMEQLEGFRKTGIIDIKVYAAIGMMTVFAIESGY